MGDRRRPAWLDLCDLFRPFPLVAATTRRGFFDSTARRSSVYRTISPRTTGRRAQTALVGPIQEKVRRGAGARWRALFMQGGYFVMRTAFVLSLAGFVSALAIAPVKADDITIAVAGPMTGPVATIGDQMKRGAEAAAAAINEAGGVAGPQDQDRRRGRRLRSQAGGRGRQSDRRPADQVRRRPRLLGLVDSGFRRLCRQQGADDEPGVDQSGADREGLSDDHARLPARRRAGRVRRAVDRQELRGQEDRHRPRQARLRQRPGDGRQGHAQQPRRPGSDVRGHQPRREGLQRASSAS